MWPGFTNVDLSPPADLICDITQLPFPENYADEIHAIHVFEHFSIFEAPGLLEHWFGILKPGGKLCLEMPDIRKIIALFAVPEIHPGFTYGGLYGDLTDNRPGMLHKWCWCPESFARLAKKVGFSAVVQQEPQFHVQVRDFRVECVK